MGLGGCLTYGIIVLFFDALAIIYDFEAIDAIVSEADP